ncbi:hypothetical protein [Haloferax sulfurifontis]|uniref:Uncharacterized protein n=2 Tax=Haloferax sulfurifontis TaxID=255616 RepID=M0I153_9EURY|nr:hypothetical protein [Haloferax sulfurifontis]ELZ89119.1 hypothetical protein C441_16529 [Haloferax sulfurifontis ATCC BAA-897]GGC68624.1 hypothetical protein GCM10007209_33280 [Haloferax sulfurifontis]
MSFYESIHQFVGERETLRSVSHYEEMTVLLTETRLVQIRHDGAQATPDEVRAVRTIQLNRPVFADCSVELESDRTVVGFRDGTGETVRMVALPARDFEFAATLSAVVGDAEVDAPFAGE